MQGQTRLKSSTELSVAIFVYCLRGGGAERVCTLLANGLAATGVHTTVITELPPNTDQYQLDSVVKRSVVGVPGQGGLARLTRTIRKTLQLRRYLKAHQPDVIVSFMTRSNVLTLAASCGLDQPVIIAERNDPRFRSEPMIDRILRRLLYGRANLLVAQTPIMEKVMRERYGLKRTVDIPNPVCPPDHAATPFRTHSGRPYLLAIGRLNPQKGFDVLLRAYAASEARASLDLVVAGKGELHEELTKTAIELGIGDQVIFTGHVEDPAPLFAGATFFVLSSRFEGFPNVLLEAMSAGLPVVSTILPSGGHAAVTDGVSGLLIPPNDVIAMTHAIDRVAADETFAQQLGENARSAASAFSIDSVVAQWQAKIEEMTR